MAEGKCRNCLRRRETFTASRFGGGNYRRPGRFYSSQLCLECAEGLLARIQPGHLTVSRWSNTSILQTVTALKEDKS